MTEHAPKEFRLSFVNAAEDVPRLVRAYGRACQGEFAMVLRPAEVNVFYEQSAALVWFLNYKAGPERRAKLAEYVRAQYIGALGAEGWKSIGYDTPEALDQAFTKFLQSTN